MDDNNKYPLKGILLSHNGDYYNGEFSEGKKMEMVVLYIKMVPDMKEPLKMIDIMAMAN